MPYDLTNYLVIGVSSRALFDLSRENEIFENEGLEAYCRYQLEHENDILEPGTGFALIEAILGINQVEPGVRRTEVVIISRNSADTSLRISNSIDSYSLDITRAAFTGGEPVAKYLNAFEVDLFLSATEEDVQAAVESNVAAGLIYDGARRNDTDPLEQIRIAFDGDAVLFSEESEMIYQNQGLEAFLEHERQNAQQPLPEGPFAKLLKTRSFLQFGRPGGAADPHRAGHRAQQSGARARDPYPAYLERAHRRNLFPRWRAQGQDSRVLFAAYLLRRPAPALRRRCPRGPHGTRADQRGRRGPQKQNGLTMQAVSDCVGSDLQSSRRCFSRRSCFSCASTVRVAIGRASRRNRPISSPVSAQ